jgi:hypothetical protein
MEKMTHPSVRSSAMKETFAKAKSGEQPNPPNRMQDIWIWDGRPVWDQIFSTNKEERRYRDIGVCFCGTPIVGKQLKSMCKKYSNLNPALGKEVVFHLHKENF